MSNGPSPASKALAGASGATLALVDQLEAAGPYGSGHPQPIFAVPESFGPESIDAVGHVNNREYLRWMEEIAVEHSAAQGWPMERYFAGGNAWVAATKCSTNSA